VQNRPSLLDAHPLTHMSCLHEIAACSVVRTRLRERESKAERNEDRGKLKRMSARVPGLYILQMKSWSSIQSTSNIYLDPFLILKTAQLWPNLPFYKLHVYYPI
jgi:hypothetical protein